MDLNYRVLAFVIYNYFDRIINKWSCNNMVEVYVVLNGVYFPYIYMHVLSDDNFQVFYFNTVISSQF